MSVMGRPLLGASVPLCPRPSPLTLRQGWANVCLVPGEGLEPARSLVQPAREQTESCKYILAQEPVTKANKLSTCEHRAGGDSSPLVDGRRLGSGKLGLFWLWIISGSFC